MKRAASVIGLSALLLSSAQGQIAVSGNDGKQLRPGDNPAGMHGDTISVLDLGHYPPRLLASVDAPASMIGPPTAVAVAPDSGFALVTAAQKPNPEKPGTVMPNDTGSVVDLANPRNPRIVQTFRAGAGIGGVSIDRAGGMAIIASNIEGSITLYAIRGKRLTEMDRLILPPLSVPTDVVFSRDGRSAYVVEEGASRLEILRIEGGKLIDTGRSIVTGGNPYGAVVTPDGKYLLDTNLAGAIDPQKPPGVPSIRAADGRVSFSGGGGDRGTIAVVDLVAGRMVDSFVVGATPEHVALSSNGRYAVVTIANRASIPPTDPNYATRHGLIRMLALSPDGKLTEVASSETGHWCQGATWSGDDKTILLQCAMESTIEIYRFDGHSLVEDKKATLKFYNRPGAIATAASR